jgi:hypothetical protein
MNETLQVFLCHASEDKPVVREMYMWLKKTGFIPWLDEYDLIPGQEWEKEIPRTVTKSGCVLVFLSHNSTTKRGYYQKEIRLALEAAERMPEGSIFIIPILIEQCNVPDSLKRWQWLDLNAKNSRQRLKSALRKIIQNNSSQIKTETIREIANGIKQGIRDTMKHYQIAKIGTELVWLYWSVGRQIQQQVKEQGISPSMIIDGISANLSKEYGQGFSTSNLMYMYTFSQQFQNPRNLPSNLSWSHCRILTGLPDQKRRHFYLSVCSQEDWSTRVLQRKIDSKLYERTKVKKREVEVPNPAVNDPYVLEFLDISDKNDSLKKADERESKS